MTWEADLKLQIPDFDLLKCNEIRSLCIGFSEAQLVELNLRVVYSDSHQIDFVFRRVRDVCLPRMPGGLFSLGELAIHDVRNHGLEGIRYKVGDELSGFSCSCADIEIKAVSAL